MTWALNQLSEGEELPPPCLYGDEVCKDGFVIPCETKYGVEACLTYLGCQETAYMSCDIPPPIPAVPLPSSGIILGATLALIVVAARLTRMK